MYVTKKEYHQWIFLQLQGGWSLTCVVIQVNGKEMEGVTREEAVLYLLGLQEQVDLLLQFRRDEYERVRAQKLGDNFYIR